MKNEKNPEALAGSPGRAERPNDSRGQWDAFFDRIDAASVDGKHFEIDEFHNENAGLVVVEVELDREDETLDLPSWVGVEVTHDPRYFNSNLARVPFSVWSSEPGKL